MMILLLVMTKRSNSELMYFEDRSFVLHFHKECFHSSNISEFDTLSREKGGIRQSNE